MFDVLDTETEQYLPLEKTLMFFNKLNKLGIEKFVPIFYNGSFVSWEHVASFVGRSDVGASPSGEGVVIKRQDNLNSKSSNSPYYLKLVSEIFSEVHKSKSKTIDLTKMEEREKQKNIVTSIVTPQRIEKMLFKLIDEGLIPENWNCKNMSEIAKILPKEIFDDCRKEEPELVLSCDNFGKICSSVTMQYVRTMLNKACTK